MKKGDFQKGANNGNQENRESNKENDAKVIPLKLQPQGPRPPAPRAPMPKAPFGMHIMPVATNIRVLPELVKSGNAHMRVIKAEDEKDE